MTDDSSLQPSEESEYVELGNVLHARFSYRLVERLGKGGFGSVFLARCLDTDPDDPTSPPESVAIKVLGSAHDPQARSYLKRELAALRTVEHDRIPKLYDWSLEGESAFVVLEYFPDGSLVDTGALEGRLDEDQTWRLLSDLLSALSAAHRASVLHLDVKPSNVLLDGDGGYVLTDFGVSHSSRMSKGLLHQGQIAVGLGTHGYRAPEQSRQNIQSFDLRTDLWGVGATAWAAYTGIDLNQRKDLRRKVENGDVFGLPHLSDVHLRCPPPLEEVIMGLLYIDPSRRPGGAAEVLARVDAIASGFGLDSQTLASARRNIADPMEIQEVIESIVDPLWASICRAPGFERYFVKFEKGETLCGVGLQAHHTFLLLRGRILVEHDDRVVATQDQEGNFLGAISTLTGAPRQVTLRADETVWTCLFNEAELEQLVTCNPAVAVRMIRTLATRIANGPSRHCD
ncbi:MAG: protein kinase [Deltaproteobacteria bacterium]|nr:protein kinase [Deltaproteobacteria bacterium]MBW2419898.1 protein kinase [Deltaproteobacteria bacterium]